MAKRIRLSTYHLPLANVPKGRYELANVDIAFTESRKKLTRSLHRTKQGDGLTQSRIETQGKSLKKGIVAFAQKAGVPSEMLNALKDMSEANLLTLYDENDILFELYFDYGGITDRYGLGFEFPEDVRARKNAQIRELIEQYGKRFAK